MAQTTATPTEFFYSDKNQRRGPLPIDMAQDIIESGELTRDTLVWYEGINWAPAETTALGRYFKTPPTMPPSLDVSNVYVWLMIISPVICIILPFTWAVGYLACMIFALLDITMIKNKYRIAIPEAYMLLVPVYLFVRSKRLGQKSWYAYAWLAWLFVYMISALIIPIIFVGAIIILSSIFG